MHKNMEGFHRNKDFYSLKFLGMEVIIVHLKDYSIFTEKKTGKYRICKVISLFLRTQNSAF